MSDITAPSSPPKIGILMLTPQNAHVFAGQFSSMYCRLQDGTLYRGVFTVLMFPIRFPEKFISLRYTDEADKEREIGVIEALSVFPPEAQQLIRSTLFRHYHEQVITRVYSIRNEYGLLFFDVETRRGREEFIMPWREERAEEYGPAGKVLRDATNNRYIIPNVSELPTADQTIFTTYIYW